MSMVLQVLQLSGNAICELQVEPADRIQELKEVVQLKVSKECTLFFDGVKLEHQDVDTSGLQDGSQVTVIVTANIARLRAGAFGKLWLRNKGKTGFTVQELKDAGCGVPQLVAAGFSVSELKTVGFTAWQLIAAGFKTLDFLQELKDAGLTLAELKALRQARFEAVDCKAVGFSLRECLLTQFSLRDCKKAGFSAADFRNEGFSAADCKRMLFSAAECKLAGFSAADCMKAGFSVAVPRGVVVSL